MHRDDMLGRIAEPRTWDILVIGGGATGLGIAVDAATRGHAVALVEQSDFAKGTSSRSTKLVHGGVRYLQQGNVSLVMEALKERGLLRQNAPQLVHDLPFVVPSYAWWESPFYGIGMKVYDLLAFRYGFGGSRHLSPDEVTSRIPNIERDGLRGGTLYHDGQFDDARLAVTLARTAADQGAVLTNYTQVTALLKQGDHVVGAAVVDRESGRTFEVRARAVVNATGPFADAIRRLDDPAAVPMIAPSQGVHVVLDRDFLSGDHAIMVPHTTDGRVMFAIPWHHVVLIGTTDTPVPVAELEPRPHSDEIDFILDTARRYLAKEPSRADIRSVYTGIRPLVKMGDASSTAALSRDHVIHIDQRSGLVTIAGGKWTTYRRMAEDLVDHVAVLAGLEHVPCTTAALRLHGWREEVTSLGDLAVYGSDSEAVAALAATSPALSARVHPRLPATHAQIVWAVRHEFARTVDDVLARRTRCLFFDSRAAIEAAPAVAATMANELGRDEAWRRGQVAEFTEIAARFVA